MKAIKIILSAMILSFLAVSCLVDDEAVDFSQGPYFVGFENDIAALSYFVDEGTVTRQFPLNLLGGADGTPTEKPITITYKIDTASTATEGQEFNFVENSGTIILPAGQSFVNFPLEVNTGSLNPNEPTKLIIELTGTTTEGAVVSALHNKLAITFVGCKSDLAGDYTSPLINGTVPVTQTTPTEYHVVGFPAVEFTSGPVEWDMTVICGKITADQIVGGAFPIEVEGVVNNDGSFTLTSWVFYLQDGSVYQSSETNGQATYTPVP